VNRDYTQPRLRAKCQPLRTCGQYHARDMFLGGTGCSIQPALPGKRMSCRKQTPSGNCTRQMSMFRSRAGSVQSSGLPGFATGMLRLHWNSTNSNAANRLSEKTCAGDTSAASECSLPDATQVHWSE
jgi:hypothetical protein